MTLVCSILCAIAGHRWDWRSARDRGFTVYRCERCGHYDDEPKIVRAAERRRRLIYWSPLTFKVTRRETWLRVGTPHHHRIPALAVRLDLHYGWEKHSEGPGITVDLHVWRLRAGVILGGLWQDEDGNGRALFRTWSDFQTHGWRYLPCWFGHKPKASDWDATYVYCDRCATTLKTVEREPVLKEAA